jgi:hypothetical protein
MEQYLVVCDVSGPPGAAVCRCVQVHPVNKLAHSVVALPCTGPGSTPAFVVLCEGSISFVQEVRVDACRMRLWAGGR